MRQIFDKADCIADQHARHAFRVKGTHRRIERGKQLVGNQHLTAGQRPHQGRFAGICIANQRDTSQTLTLLPARTLGLALDLHGIDFHLQFGDTVADLAPIKLGVRLPAATTARATALPPLRPGQLGRLAQARCHITQAGNFDLCPCGARTGVAMKDFEDDHRPVHHLAADIEFQITRLRGGNLVVNQDCFNRPRQ